MQYTNKHNLGIVEAYGYLFRSIEQCPRLRSNLFEVHGRKAVVHSQKRWQNSALVNIQFLGEGEFERTLYSVILKRLSLFWANLNGY